LLFGNVDEVLNLSACVSKGSKVESILICLPSISNINVVQAMFQFRIISIPS